MFWHLCKMHTSVNELGCFSWASSSGVSHWLHCIKLSKKDPFDHLKLLWYTVQTSFHYLQRCIKSLLFQILTVCGRLGCWLVSASWFCERSSTKGRWHACVGRCLLLVQSSPWNRYACHTPSLQGSQSHWFFLRWCLLKSYLPVQPSVRCFGVEYFLVEVHNETGKMSLGIQSLFHQRTCWRRVQCGLQLMCKYIHLWVPASPFSFWSSTLCFSWSFWFCDEAYLKKILRGSIRCYIQNRAISLLLLLVLILRLHLWVTLRMLAHIESCDKGMLDFCHEVLIGIGI